MGGAGTFLVTVGVAVAILALFFLVYYLSSIATTVYDMKIDVRRDTEKKLSEMRHYVEKELSNRSVWMRGELAEATARLRSDLDKANADVRQDLDERLTVIERELASLRIAANGTEEPPAPARKGPAKTPPPKPKPKPVRPAAPVSEDDPAETAPGADLAFPGPAPTPSS